MPFNADWNAPDNVVAFTTFRSEPIDMPSIRERLPGQQRVQRLSQVHGVSVVDATGIAGEPEADACYSRQADTACLVVTADCLPLLVCNRQGSEIAAIHAGWRGLAGGVIEATLGCLRSAAEDLLVWLGPAICSQCFEIGPEVRDKFLETAPVGTEAATDACFRPGRDDRFMADLYGLARMRLGAIGVLAVTGGTQCTYTDTRHFHSYRRDGADAGRMASVVAFR